MTYVACSVGAVVLYLWLGLGPTLLLCPPRLRPYALALAPPLGLAMATLLGWAAYNLHWGPVSSLAWGYLAAPGLLLFLRRKADWRPAEGMTVAALLAVLAWAALSLPCFGNFTHVASECDDGVFYAWGCRYVQDFPPASTAGLYSHFEMYYFVQTRFGLYFADALTASVLGRPAWQMLNLTAHVFFALTVLLCFSLARVGFRCSVSRSLLLTGLVALNPMMARCAYAGFFPQLLAACFAVGLLVIVLDADSWDSVPLGALLAWGLLCTYPHMLPLVAVPLVLVRWRQWRPVAAMLAVPFLLSTEKLAMLWAEMHVQAGNTALWYEPSLLSYKVFTSTFDLHTASVWRDAALSTLLLGALAWAWRQHRPWVPLILAGCVLLEYALLACLNLRSEGTFGGYQSFKVFSFFVPWILVSLFSACGDRLLLGLVLYELAFVGAYLPTLRTIPPTMPQLASLDQAPVPASINLMGRDGWMVMWEACFLAHKPLYFGAKTYVGASSRLDGEWDLYDATDMPPQAWQAHAERVRLGDRWWLMRRI